MGKHSFSGTGFADESEDFAFTNGERNSVEGTMRRWLGRIKIDGQALYSEEVVGKIGHLGAEHNAAQE